MGQVGGNYGACYYGSLSFGYNKISIDYISIAIHVFAGIIRKSLLFCTSYSTLEMYSVKPDGPLQDMIKLPACDVPHVMIYLLLTDNKASSRCKYRQSSREKTIKSSFN